MSDAEKWLDATPAYLRMMEDDTEAMNGLMIRKACLHSALLERLVERSFERSLDLGCGEGWLCRFLCQLARGAVHGLDLSVPALQAAMQKAPAQSASSTRYVVADISTSLPYQDRAFDLIIANLVLQWLESLDTVMREIYRVCSASGRVIITLSHPYFTNKAGHWELSNPDDPFLVIRTVRPRKIITTIGAHSQSRDPIGPLVYYHRLISDYFGAFIRAGLSVVHMDEVFCQERIVEIDPSWIRHVRVPLFILFELARL